MKIKLSFIESLFSESPKVSMIRFMSLIMLVIAIWFLFFSYNILFKSTIEMGWPVVVLLILQNLINYFFAFFPKLIQKKFEQVDVNKLIDKS